MKIAFTYNKKNIFSRMIAWVTGSPWSHCFIVIGPFYSDRIIAEASVYGGVKFNLVSRYDEPDKYNYEEYDLGDIDTIASEDMLMSKIGDRYGYAEIIGNLVARVFRLKKNPFTDDEVCSEYVLLVLRESKLGSQFMDLDPNKVSPGELRDRIRKLTSTNS
jgi:hypothetical protein